LKPPRAGKDVRRECRNPLSRHAALASAAEAGTRFGLVRSLAPLVRIRSGRLFAWYRAESRPPFSKAVVQQYRAHLEAQNLAPSTINVRLAAVRKLGSEAADNGLLVPELAVGISKVKGVKKGAASG
jgi:hypothetical protein